MLGRLVGSMVSRTDRSPAVETGACSRSCRVVHARDDCDACARACPHDAVELGPLHLKPACDACQLCITACPTAALQESPAVRRRMIEILGKLRRGEPFSLACGRAEPPTGAYLSTPCLAGAGWELPTAALLLGASTVELRSGECSVCEHAAHAVNTICWNRTLASGFADALGLGEVSLQPVPLGATESRARPAPEPAVSRRDLFAGLFRRGRSAAVSAGADLIAGLIEGDGGRQRPRHTPWKRELIRGLLGRKQATDLPTIDVIGLSGRPRLDDGRCSRCAICAAACPTGALEAGRRAGAGSEIRLHSHLCTGCGLCARSCREDAITLERRIDLREWASADPVVLAAAKPGRRCHACGEHDAITVQGLCSTCHRMRCAGSTRRNGTN